MIRWVKCHGHTLNLSGIKITAIYIYYKLIYIPVLLVCSMQIFTEDTCFTSYQICPHIYIYIFIFLISSPQLTQNTSSKSIIFCIVCQDFFHLYPAVTSNR